ncbi:MAG: PSP1 C-terminal domain-containing protein [Acholeplasmataceae bacterium]
MSYVKKQALELALNMSVIRVHLSFDETHILVEFDSEQRVDFRELVKRLSETYHARIEMKQMPKLGSDLESEYGLVKVIDINYLSKKDKLKHRDGYIQWVGIPTQE